MSLYKWGGLSNTKTFVGMDNFKVLWDDMDFIESFQNSILLIVLVAIITIFFALTFAAILTREYIAGQNFFWIIFYIPNILSIVVFYFLIIIVFCYFFFCV